jgi:hypothetical protein
MSNRNIIATGTHRQVWIIVHSKSIETLINLPTGAATMRNRWKSFNSLTIDTGDATPADVATTC